jgi:cysteinyl-tRNA synthetase
VLGISTEEAALPAEVSALAEARLQARLAKDWRKSDELRDELAARGWEARDTKDGQKITRRGGS